MLARIEKLDPALNAYVTLTADRALADARAAEEYLRRGDDRPLLGIPIAHKDIYCTRGIRTTGGSALLADWVPDEDATCVQRWQAAGTVMLGKLITHEFAFGIQFPGHRFPPARNPWNRDHIPGGSSSGSGAALAAGLVHGATGSDTGGSIRGPAAFCGIVGLKPTYGRCSRAGVLTLSWTLDHTGPMARTVEDCALLLQPLAGHDPLDPASSRAPVDDYLAPIGRDVRGLRIAVPRNFFFEGVDPEVARAFEEAMATMRQLGVEVRDVQIPSLAAAPSFLLIMLAEAYAYHERDLRTHPELYGNVLRERMMAGGLVTGSEYVQAQRIRAQIAQDVAAVLARGGHAGHAHRALPGAAVHPGARSRARVPAQQHAAVQHHRLADPGAAVRILVVRAAAVVPAAGRPFEEGTVLRAGHAYEQATPWHTRRPSVLSPGDQRRADPWSSTA